MYRFLIAGLLVVIAGCDGAKAPDPAGVAAEQTILDKYGGEKLPVCSHASPIARGSAVTVQELPSLGVALVFVDDQPFCMDSISAVETVLAGGNWTFSGGSGAFGNGVAASGGVDPMPARTLGKRDEPLDPMLPH